MTPDLLRAATGCTPERAALFAPHLSAACLRYRITGHVRMAAFLAQIGHESGSLRYTSELWGPTPAQERYEGRADLGNTRPGDGSRYRGRGLIQVTGRDNYRAVSRRMQPLDAPDFEDFPAAVEEPRWAAWTAADWWAANGCNELADSGDFVALTRRINGGTNGLQDRQARWERAKAALATSYAPAEPTNAASGPADAPQPYPDTIPAGDAPDWTPPPAKERPMAPIIAALLPSIIEAIPRLGKVFGSGSAVAERNIKAAELVVEAVRSATGAINAQEAVERLAKDPAAVAAATRAIDGIWYELTEAGGGGIDGARKAALEYAMPDGPRFWFNPAFWVSMILLTMPMMLLVDVFYVHPESYTGEIRTQIVTGVLMVISMVGAYWIGTSFSSAKKDERNRAPQ